MSASTSTIGYGDTLEWSTDDTTWNEIAELKTADIPTNTVEKVERTHMNSPDRTKEYTPGLRDTNDVPFTFNFNSEDYEALYTLEANATVATWRHTLAPNDGEATGAVYEYDGFVEIGGAPREVEGITEVSATIKRAGAFTFTPGVSA